MKRLIISILIYLPLMVAAQDNTWERIEVAQDKENPNAKYLVEDAVPVVDGKVCWSTTIEAPGKSAKQIYDILLNQITKMTKEPNQMETSKVVVKNEDTYELGAIFREWLVFKSVALSLDKTILIFQLHIQCADGKADVKINNIQYDYDLARKPVHYTAEEWITDKNAVNKKRTKLYPQSGKFRRKTIDRKDFIFNKFTSLLNE